MNRKTCCGGSGGPAIQLLDAWPRVARKVRKTGHRELRRRVEGLDVAANDPRQDGFADIYNFLRSPPADRAVADQMGIDVTATAALDGVGLQILPHEKGLHFP